MTQVQKHTLKFGSNCWRIRKFEPRKTNARRHRFFEDKGVEYFVKDPEL
jgi:hypothetical protein